MMMMMMTMIMLTMTMMMIVKMISIGMMMIIIIIVMMMMMMMMMIMIMIMIMIMMILKSALSDVFTITMSLCRELSQTRARSLSWARRNRVQITHNKPISYHMQCVEGNVV